VLKKPLLAVEYECEFHKGYFPLLATPKIDGVRFIMVNGAPLTRSFKPIPNEHINGLLRALPDGCDGEITVGETFQSTTSAVMSKKGEPTFKVWLFDFVKDLSTPYFQRVEDLAGLRFECQFEVEKLIPTQVNNLEELLTLEELFLSKGFEGVMLRKPDGKYKCGRSTAKEAILLKKKIFTDSEAVIIGFVEEQMNTNEAFINETGHTARSTHKANQIGKESLGAFVAIDFHSGVPVKIGSGFTASQRQEFWVNRDLFLGKLVKYKYFPFGIKVAPRHPVFIGFRNPLDL
jgi:DNA ligase 1